MTDRADVVLDEQSGVTSITLVSGFTVRTLRTITSIVFMNVFLQSGQPRPSEDIHGGDEGASFSRAPQRVETNRDWHF